MMARGFYGAPIFYEGPTILLQKDRLEQVVSPTFWLSWRTPMHSLLFYLQWNDYHWATGLGEEVRILRLRNDGWERAHLQSQALRTLGDRSSFGPADFLQFWQATQNIPRGLGA